MEPPRTSKRLLLVGRTSEAEVELYVAASCRAFGWRRYHTHDSRHSPEGFPDDVLVHPQRQLTVFAELKGYDSRGRLGEPTVEQLDWLHTLRAAGQHAYLWTPLDVELIDQVLEHGNTAELPPLPEPTAAALRRHQRKALR